MKNLVQKQANNDIDLEKVWFHCKSQIADSINKDEKEVWLDNINLLEFRKEQMVLGGLNNFFCNWIKNNRASLLKKSLFSSFKSFLFSFKILFPTNCNKCVFPRPFP